MQKIKRSTLTALALALVSTAGLAAETVTHTYDSKGRLVKVVRTGTVNNNNQVCYKLDKVGNRVRKKATVNSLPACP